MNAKDLLLLTVWLCGAAVVPMPAAASQVSKELPAFVNNAVAELVSSPLQVPQFKSAQVETIEDLGPVGGVGRYLCWLKNDHGRVGYVAVAAASDAFAVIAFSATTAPPNYFLKHLEVGELRPLRLSKATQVSFVDNLPLVAATQTLLATDPIEISDVAASLSSILNHLQQAKEVLFFGHVGTEFHPDYRRRLMRDRLSGARLQDPNKLSFKEEYRQVIAHADIPQGQNSKERAIANLQRRDIISPIVRRTLLAPASARERLYALQGGFLTHALSRASG